LVNFVQRSRKLPT